MNLLEKKLNKKRGFTLVELIFALAIVGILAAIAIPSYENSMIKSRRADGQAALMNFANAMERHFTEANTYCDAATSGVSDPTCGDGGMDYGIYPSGEPDVTIFKAVGKTAENYDFTITLAQDTPNPFFTIRATAKGRQANDGNLELDSTGQKWWDQNKNGDPRDAGENTWDEN